MIALTFDALGFDEPAKELLEMDRLTLRFVTDAGWPQDKDTVKVRFVKLGK